MKVTDQQITSRSDVGRVRTLYREANLRMPDSDHTKLQFGFIGQGMSKFRPYGSFTGTKHVSL